MKRAALVLGLGLLFSGWVQAQTGLSPTSIRGFYLRGEAGLSKARDARFRDDNPNSPECILIATGPGQCAGTLDDMGTGWTVGFGVGFSSGGPFRADLSYSYRTGFNLRGADIAGTFFDPNVQADTVMLNGYYDLPVMLKSVRPFIGGGIGRSRNKMDPLNWNDPGCCTGRLTGGTHTDTAWQLTLGANVVLDRNFILEIFYRYTDLGEFKKERGPDQAGLFGTGVTGPATGRLRSNELVVGFRRGF